MTFDELQELMEQLTPVVQEAGKTVTDTYSKPDDHQTKSDGSPVTLADKRSEEIILTGLKNIAPNIPVISEENTTNHSLAASKLFFLVDPLDGTREFIKRDGKGSFTVNIALIKDNIPILGFVFAPALNRFFCGVAFNGDSFATENGERISVRTVPDDGPVAVASVSHGDFQTDNWLNENKISKTKLIGSSLKFCLLAAGEADIYPRFSPTMEWDTAAGDAVLRAAGGLVENIDGKPFEYGKPDYRNGSFIAKGKLATTDL